MQAFRRPSRKHLAIAACVAGAVIAPSIAVAANAAGNVSAELAMYSPTEWYGSGQFEVTNTTSAAQTYSLSFDVENGDFVNNSEWNTNTVVAGSRVTITPKQPLAAGQSDHLSFGIQGAGQTGKVVAVSSCDLDGDDVAGCSSDGGEGTPGDTTAPTVPQNLTAHHNTAKGDDVVHVMWSGSKDDVGVKGYEIERDGEHLRNHEPGAGGMATMVDIDGHEAGRRYEYRVRAYDAAGNASAWSEPTAIDLPGGDPDTEAPVVGSPRISFDRISASGAHASWAAATDDVGVDHYETTTFGPAGQSKKNVTTTGLDLAGLAPSTTYAVVAHAVDAAGNRSAMPYSGEFTTLAEEVEEPGAPEKGVPSGFEAVADTYRDGDRTMHRIAMRWTPDAAAANRYEVFLDGKRAQTLLVVNAGDPLSKPTDEQSRYLTIGDAAAGHKVKLRAQLADGSWSAFTPEITVK